MESGTGVFTQSIRVIVVWFSLEVMGILFVEEQLGGHIFALKCTYPADCKFAWTRHALGWNPSITDGPNGQHKANSSDEG